MAAQEALQAGDVHQLMQAVFDGLLHQRVRRDLPLPGEVVLTGKLVGKHHRHEIFRLGPLEWRRDFLPPVVAPHRQGDAGVPTPVGGKHGCGQQGLGDPLPDASGMDETGGVFQRKAVSRAQGQRQAVV